MSAAPPTPLILLPFASDERWTHRFVPTAVSPAQSLVLGSVNLDPLYPVGLFVLTTLFVPWFYERGFVEEIAVKWPTGNATGSCWHGGKQVYVALPVCESTDRSGSQTSQWCGGQKVVSSLRLREIVTNPFSVSRVLWWMCWLWPADEVRGRWPPIISTDKVSQCNGVTENSRVKNRNYLPTKFPL